jgi:hypothetical protein
MPELIAPIARLHAAWLEAHAEWGPEARVLGLDRVLAVCALDNVASVKTIERCRGVFDAWEPAPAPEAETRIMAVMPAQVTAGERFLDVTNRVGPAGYWQRASAFELLAAQSDLLPDDKVATVSPRWRRWMRWWQARSATRPCSTPMSVTVAAMRHLPGTRRRRLAGSPGR